MAKTDEVAVWPAITLEIVGREDGGIRVTSPNVPGLIMSHFDIPAVFRDLPEVIPALLEKNGYRPSAQEREIIERCAKVATTAVLREGNMALETGDQVHRHAADIAEEIERAIRALSPDTTAG